MSCYLSFSAANAVAASAASAAEAVSAAAAASSAAATAASAASAAVLALKDALEKLTASPESKGEAPADASTGPGKPLSAADVMRLVAALSPERAARRGGDRGDCPRVGLALRHNEALLRKAGRHPEAELMATFYDVFCMRDQKAYPGRPAVIEEYAGLGKTTAITIETLGMMADEDRVADAADSAPSGDASDKVTSVGKNSLFEWLDATLIITGDESDVVSQADILALMRSPKNGWKFAARHKAKKIKQFLKGWCASKGVYYGDDKYSIGDVRFHQVHCKGIVIKQSNDSDSDSASSSDTSRYALGSLICTKCKSLDLLIDGLCGECCAQTSNHRSKEKRVREVFDENSMIYSSNNKAIDGGFRPDFVFDAVKHFVVVEVDENQHKAYPADAERTRMLSLSRSLRRPTVFVRYNPDAYVPGGGDDAEPLSNREKTLVNWVRRLISTPLLSRGSGVLYLFFDGFSPGREKVAAL